MKQGWRRGVGMRVRKVRKAWVEEEDLEAAVGRRWDGRWWAGESASHTDPGTLDLLRCRRRLSGLGEQELWG